MLNFRWNVPVVTRIAFGLVNIVGLALLTVSFVGLYPDPDAELVKDRKAFCDNVAIGVASLADKADAGTMRLLLKTYAKRRKDVATLGLRRDDGELPVEYGGHAAAWKTKGGNSRVWVHFYTGNKPWGALEATFRRPPAGGWLSSAAGSVALHSLLVLVVSAAGFYIYLRIVLKHLDPSQVVPNRVREALDTLAEGLLIVDLKQRIALANRAFEAAVNAQPEQLLGRSVNRLGLAVSDDEPCRTLPWVDALTNNTAVQGRLLTLPQNDNTVRTYSVSASPILNENQSLRGALVSFEDVTILENKKHELRGMVEHLQASGDAIKKQNVELERLATSDSLTGCLNRRSFFQKFDACWQAAESNGQPVCAMMVDIDFFKSINDNFGHSTGDDVLRDVAHTLLNNVRSTDIVCRYGGEEFSILLPGATVDTAAAIAEDIRLAIAALTFAQDLTITASLGVSTRTPDTLQPQELLDQADKCLYVAKRNGRNQVVRWDTVPADLVIDESKISRTKEETAASPSVPYHAVTALISALAYRDYTTAAHSRRVADLCVAAAEGLLSLRDCYNLEIAALLHDIGKIGVPDQILLKPGALTREEWQVMRRNDTMGKELVRASFASPQLTAIVENYQIHYGVTPEGRAGTPIGDQIPVGARILAIADAYDSMTTDRSYRKGVSPAEAFAELRKCAGKQFDPELVERFVERVADMGSDVRQSTSNVSIETALSIGLQMERLADTLDNQDFDAIDALSRKLHLTARKGGVTSIEEKSGELEKVLESDRDPHAILQMANELLDLCRSTQQSFLISPQSSQAYIQDPEQPQSLNA